MRAHSMFQEEYWEREALGCRRPPDHPVIRAYVDARVRRVLEVVPIGPESTLLDVGCGNGFFTARWGRSCRAVGTDRSARMLSINPHRPLIRMDAGRLGFKDDSFDVVFCASFLHHVADPGAMIAEMRRVSRRYVVVVEPNRANPLMALFSLIVKAERKGLGFSLEYVRRIVREQDLRVLDAFSFGMIMPNKTPSFLLPVFRSLEFRWTLGTENIVIAEKKA